MSLPTNHQHTQSQRTIISFTGVLCSRTLGFVRDSLLAYVLGASADIFFVAYRIPNMIRRLMAEGILGMSHTAIVTKIFYGDATSENNFLYEKRTFLQGLSFSSHVFFHIVLWASMLSLVLALFSPTIMTFFAPGFSKESIEKASYYLRLCLPYIPLAMGSAIVAATLNAMGRFVASSFVSCVLNISIIASLLLFLASTTMSLSLVDPATWVCFGILSGAFLQLLFLLFDVYRGYTKSRLNSHTTAQHNDKTTPLFNKKNHLSLPLSIRTPHQEGASKALKQKTFTLHASKQEALVSEIPKESAFSTETPKQDNEATDIKGKRRVPTRRKEEEHIANRRKEKALPRPRDVIKAMPWSVLGGASQQINMIIAYSAASFLVSGSISALFFAERLMELPLTLAGATIATVALPHLAILAQKEKQKRFQYELGMTLLSALFVILPASMGLAGIALPCVTLFFGHGHFDQQAVEATASGLRIFCVGLPGMCISRILTTAMTTLELSSQKKNTLSALAFFISALVTACACFFLTKRYYLNGVCLSVVLGAWTQALFLFVFLYRQGYAPIVSQKGMLRSAGYLLLAYGMFLLLSCLSFPYESKVLLTLYLVGCVFGLSLVWLFLLRFLRCDEALYFFKGIFAQKQ